VHAVTVLTASLVTNGLYFTPWQLATFYTALQTKGFVILSGISGTGKTKLAQAFAALLPQPATGKGPTPDDTIEITVQPYMLKYGRLIVPQRATRLFDPPPEGQAAEVRVAFEGKTQSCRLVHAAYGNGQYLSLLLKATARKWFSSKFAAGDTLLLQPELDDDQNLTGFRLSTETSQPEPGTEPNYLFVSVRPDWRDPKSLLGYYNPLTQTYEPTDFLRFLLRAERNYRSENPLAWFVILDEMNLAHVEYYFADLLSVLESGRDEAGWTREPLRLSYPDEAEGDLPPRELYLPPNLYIVGTVNVDETTQAFSPKVLDRAFTLELTEADFSAYPPSAPGGQSDLSDDQRWAILVDFSQGGDFARIEKKVIEDYVGRHPEARVRLQTLNALLRPHELHFGYRVFDEIISFLAAAEGNELYADLGGAEAAFDAAVLMKVLPKFHGSRGKLEKALIGVLAWCVNPDQPAVESVEQTIQDTSVPATMSWPRSYLSSTTLTDRLPTAQCACCGRCMRRGSRRSRREEAYYAPSSHLHHQHPSARRDRG
jgi:energy-coupling factor transporter ATP-binding protein EcfA2